MSRRDLFHEAVRNALIKEGWDITHDPYILKFGEQKLQVDLGAEMPLAAEREGRKIAVEIKSFIRESSVTDLYMAIGQYAVYRRLLNQQEAERILYLAIPNDAFEEVFDPAHGRDIREALDIRLIVYEAEEEVIVRWIG